MMATCNCIFMYAGAHIEGSSLHLGKDSGLRHLSTLETKKALWTLGHKSDADRSLLGSRVECNELEMNTFPQRLIC